MWPPSEPPTTARRLDPQVVHQPLLHLDHVADGDDGKIAAIGPAGPGIGAVRARRAAAAAQDVGANDEVSPGVDRLARPHHQIPPAGIVLFIVPGYVGIARQGMAN